MPITDPDERRAYQRNWVARRRAAWMAGKACESCGSTENLHVHHRDPAEKVTHNVWSWGQARRDAELAKCAVLCETCHRDYHARVLERHGTTRRYQAGCRCGLCRWAKQISNERYRLSRAEREAA